MNTQSSVCSFATTILCGGFVYFNGDTKKNVQQKKWKKTWIIFTYLWNCSFLASENVKSVWNSCIITWNFEYCESILAVCCRRSIYILTFNARMAIHWVVMCFLYDISDCATRGVLVLSYAKRSKHKTLKTFTLHTKCVWIRLQWFLWLSWNMEEILMHS